MLENRTVLRAVFSSILSLLLMATLLFGGCISCPQFFMFPKVSEKNCCSKSQCERPQQSAPAKECKRMPVEAQGFTHLEIAVVAVAAQSVFLTPVIAAASLRATHPDTAANEHSPPDLNILHSVFLI